MLIDGIPMDELWRAITSIFYYRNELITLLSALFLICYEIYVDGIKIWFYFIGPRSLFGFSHFHVLSIKWILECHLHLLIFRWFFDCSILDSRL